MTTHEAIKIESSNDGLAARSTWMYRGHRLRYIQGSGSGYPWKVFYLGTSLQHCGIAKRNKAECIESIDKMIEQGRLSDLSA